MRSVQRTIAILETLAKHSEGIRLADIAGTTGLNTATVHRFMNALLQLQYATRTPGDGRYFLGHRASRLGPNFGLMMLQGISRQYMKKLQITCDHDVNLAILDSGKVFYVETQRSSNILSINYPAGLQMPIYASSVGKAIVAFLPEAERDILLTGIDFHPFTPTTIVSKPELLRDLELTKERGYALDKEEHTLGLVCIGAPIFNIKKRPVAALSIAALVQQISYKDLESLYADSLVDAAHQVSKLLAAN